MEPTPAARPQHDAAGPSRGLPKGTAVLAATPLGQAGDASPRLASALATADVVAAEDTRRLRTLAASLGVEIGGRVVSYFDQNEVARTPQLLDEIRSGATVLVVTDAGMPAVSDPGFRLVVACVAAGLPVTCLPGPSAVTTALALSGLAADRFCFDGFPPRKQAARRAFYGELAGERRTMVLFEAPHRLADSLADAAAELGADRRAAVCRELTKTYEEVRRGSLGELADWAAGGVRGEITLVIAGATPAVVTLTSLADAAEELVASGIKLSRACAQVADGTPFAKADVYNEVLARRG